MSKNDVNGHQEISPKTQQIQQTKPMAGLYLDGRTSSSKKAWLSQTSDGILLSYQDYQGKEQLQQLEQVLEMKYSNSEFTIEPPLGKIRRVVKFADGGRFETDRLPEFAKLEKDLGKNRGLSFVNWLESSWKWALGSLVATAVFALLFFFYGLPAMSQWAADASPSSFLAVLDEEAIEMLDNGKYMSASQLSQQRQLNIIRQFEKVKTWADSNSLGGKYPYRLLLRNGEPKENNGGGFAIGANAFALPNGTIVMTDQLIALSKDDSELMGVLAHEIGHVQHRHSLASIYRAAGVGVIVVAVTGDLVSTTTMAAAVPVALLHNGYSRKAESESDALAGEYLMKYHKTTKPLRDLLARLEQDDKSADEHSVTAGSEIVELAMSHPDTKKRIEQLRQIEQASR